jgi:hypothetical protein
MMLIRKNLRTLERMEKRGRIRIVWKIDNGLVF